jgi:hypothetical protein
MKIAGFQGSRSFFPIDNGHFLGVFKMCIFRWSVFTQKGKVWVFHTSPNDTCMVPTTGTGTSTPTVVYNY